MSSLAFHARTGFHLMSKPSGPLCNLACRYCFYLEKEKLYPAASRWAMSDDVLETYVRDYIQAQDVPVVNFAWQGGEPTLLGIDFFKRAVELQRKYADGKRIENAFQTNGILLEDRWAEFLASHRFLVGLSIDGPPELHDRYRVDRGGRPTCDRVLKGLGFLKKHGAEFNTMTVVQRDNSRHPLEVYRFLKEIGSRFIQFIPVVERISEESESGLVLLSPDSHRPARVSEWSVLPEQFGRFLCEIFDEWVRNDVGRHFVQLFDVSLESWARVPSSLCLFSETCGRAMIIEHNGDIYSCDHYVYPENRLGNLLETPLAILVESDQQRKFGQEKKDRLPKACIECEFGFACHGECPKHRFVTTPDGEPGLNFLCSGYQVFFKHIDTYMEFMARELEEERSPANVMRWTRERDMRVSGRRHPGRNDPCPCGSGKKYKKCCG